MGFFGTKKNAVQPVTTEAESASLTEGNERTGAKAGTIEQATRWLEAVKRNRDDAAALDAKAKADLALAQEKHAVSVSAFEAAVDRYNSDESEGLAKAVLDACQARDLVAAQLQRRQKAMEEASNGLKVAEEAVAKAQEDVAKTERAELVAELQEAAGVAKFQKKARPATQRFVKARAEMHAALDELMADYEAANAAANALLSMGEPARRLDPVQLISQYCLFAAEKDPTLVDGFIRALQTNDHVPSASAFNGESLRDSLFRLLSGHPISLVDQAGRKGVTSEDRAGRGDPSSVPLPIEDLHDFFRDTRGAWTERVKARRKQQEIEHADESNRARKEAARAARLASAEAT